MNKDKTGGWCSMHGRYQKCVRFWSENLGGRDLLEHLGLDWEVILKRILSSKFMSMCFVSIWLIIETTKKMY